MAKLGDQIEKDIFRVISSSDRPVSSREISLKINRAWHSVNTHCLKLQISGKINGYHVGNTNIWSVKNE